jgi:uncharacterized protein (TIGR02099 family)
MSHSVPPEPLISFTLPALRARYHRFFSRYPRLRVLLRVGAWATGLVYFVFVLLLIALRYAILPQIENYRGDIERMIGTAINRPVAIRHIEAHWIGLRPALKLEGFAIRDKAGQTALGFEQIEAELAWDSIWHQELRLARLEIEAPNLVLRRDRDGRLFAASLEVTPHPGDEASFGDWLMVQDRVVIRNATVVWQDEQRNAPALELKNLNFQLDNGRGRHRFGFTADPPKQLAARIDIRGDFKGRDIDELESWKGDVFAELEYADLAGWKSWVDYPVLLPQGSGALRLWLGIDQKRLTSATADVRLADVRLQLRPELPQLDLLTLNGRLGGRRLDSGFEIEAKQLALTTRAGLTIEPTDLKLSWQAAAANRPLLGSASANGLNLAALAKLAAYLPFDDGTRARLAKHAPHGRIFDLKLSWKGALEALESWNIDGRFEGLGLTALGPVPGIAGINGHIEGSEKGGTLRLDGTHAGFELPTLFADPNLTLEAFAAEAQWKTTREGTRVNLQKLSFQNKDAAGEATGNWHSAVDGPGDIDMTAKLTRGSGEAVWRYMPLTVGKVARDWLQTGITGGGTSEAALKLKGNLAKFPFRDGSGIFEVRGKFNRARLNYAENWPPIEDIDGEFLFQGVRMLITASKAKIYGVKLHSVRAEIADLELPEELLTVSGKANGPTTDFLRYIESSPVGEQIDHFTDEMRAEGDGELDIKLVLPLRKLANSRVDGNYRFDGNRLTVDADLPPLTDVRGTLHFDSDSMEAKALRGNLLGNPFMVDIKTLGDGNVQAHAAGEISIAALRQKFTSSLFDHLSGSARWNAALRVRKKTAEVKVTSNLVGLSSSLPEPFNKSATEALAFSFERKPPAESALPKRQKAAEATTGTDLLDISLGTVARLQLIRRHDTESSKPPTITRGLLNVGENATAATTAAAMPERALLVSVNVPRINADFWRALGDRSNAEANGESKAANSLLSTLPALQFDLRTGDLTLTEKTLHDVRVTGSRAESTAPTRFDLKSREVSGNFEWLAGGAGKLTGRIAQFAVPEAATSPTTLQARASAIVEQLPALDITVDHLSFKNRDLGTVRIAAENREGYWNSKVDVSNEDGTLEVIGRWRPNPNQPDTRMEIKLNAKNLENQLARFGYPEAMRRGSANASGTLSWSGTPFSIDYPTLNGNLTLEAASGQFRKLEPGVGRLLGILSLQSLPRRITLDFRDIFSEGFAFDSIDGKFAVARGVMETSDLQINGPSAKVLMSGSVNLGNETQNLKVNVQPAVGESIAVGAMIANPVAGAIAWVAQKLLKNPLDKAFAFDYTITGSWADPKVEKVGQAPAAKVEPKK